MILFNKLMNKINKFICSFFLVFICCFFFRSVPVKAAVAVHSTGCQQNIEIYVDGSLIQNFNYKVHYIGNKTTPATFGSSVQNNVMRIYNNKTSLTPTAPNTAYPYITSVSQYANTLNNAQINTGGSSNYIYGDTLMNFSIPGNYRCSSQSGWYDGGGVYTIYTSRAADHVNMVTAVNYATSNRTPQYHFLHSFYGINLLYDSTLTTDQYTGSSRTKGIYFIGRYLLRFNANGGSLTETSRYVEYNQKYSNAMYANSNNNNSNKDLPTPTREGYTFDGWYTKVSGGTKITKDTVMGARQINGVDIYAHWTINSYTLTANPNGGNIPATTGWTVNSSNATKSIKYDTTYGTLPTPTRTGYTFNGWYTATAGGTQVTSSTKMGASDKTIYAHWTINSYTLTANPNGGNIPATTGWTVNSSNATKSIKYDTTYGTLPAPTRTGYTFNGWYTAATGGTQVTSSTKMGASDKTIYAHWTAHNLTITLNPNGGVENDINIAAQYNVSQSLSPYKNSFTKNGYVLIGWNTQQFTTKKTIDKSGSITPTENITLYAVWQKTGTGFIQLPYNHANMFINDEKLVGGNGTTYNSAWVDGRYAHIDGTQPPYTNPEDGSVDVTTSLPFDAYFTLK